VYGEISGELNRVSGVASIGRREEDLSTVSKIQREDANEKNEEKTCCSREL
jgi:hypothetical protein